MRISDWSSDVCSADLHRLRVSGGDEVLQGTAAPAIGNIRHVKTHAFICGPYFSGNTPVPVQEKDIPGLFPLQQRRQFSFRVRIEPSFASSFGEPQEIMRSEEHTSELLSLMRISYAVCCL